MTSEILQLFTQALEMLISWSSFDCILDSRTCNFIYRTIMIKPVKTTSHNTVLRASTQWVLNGSVQFTAMLHLKRLFIVTWLGGTGQLVERWTWSFCGLRGCWPCGNFSSSGAGRYITTVTRLLWESDPHEFQSHSATDSQVMSDNLHNLSTSVTLNSERMTIKPISLGCYKD